MVVILFHYGFPELEKSVIVTLILPRHYPAVLTIFAGRAAKVFHKAGQRTPLILATYGTRYWLETCSNSSFDL